MLKVPCFIIPDVPDLLASFPGLRPSPLLTTILSSLGLLFYNNNLLGNSMLCHLFSLLTGHEN